MKTQRRFWLLAVAVVMALTFSGAHSVNRAAVGDGDDSAAESKIINGFTAALVLMQDHYAGQVDPEKVTKGSIQGMLHTLDPHSSYLDRKEWQSFQNEQRSR